MSDIVFLSRMLRSFGRPIEHGYQRYQRRRPSPESTPPTRKPISHSTTAAIRIHQSTWATNPSPPKMASNKSKTTRATTMPPNVGCLIVYPRGYDANEHCVHPPSV